MADAPCDCLQCRIRRAAFGSEDVIGPEEFVRGLKALAAEFGLALANADGLLVVHAVDTFTDSQNRARAFRESRSTTGTDIASMEVAGHG